MKFLLLSDNTTYAPLEGCKIIECADREYDDLEAVLKAISEDGETVDGRVMVEFPAEPPPLAWAAVKGLFEAMGWKVQINEGAFGNWAEVDAGGKRHEMSIFKGQPIGRRR